jgi:hypothetical protein
LANFSRDIFKNQDLVAPFMDVPDSLWNHLTFAKVTTLHSLISLFASLAIQMDWGDKS